MKLTFGTLFSGSSGNAVCVSLGADAILIDAGRSARYLTNALRQFGQDLSAVRAIFITHEHEDHTSALRVLTRHCTCPVYIPRACMEGMDFIPDNALFYEGLPDFSVGPFTVRGFLTPHDSYGSVGYVVEAAGRKFGVATDMGMLSKNAAEALAGCNAAIVECNYDEEMLKTGSYEPRLKQRIAGARGHLSNGDGALLCAYLAYSGAESLLLGHLSSENNTPEKAEAAVRAEFARRGVNARVLCASRELPTTAWEEER